MNKIELDAIEKHVLLSQFSFRGKMLELISEVRKLQIEVENERSLHSCALWTEHENTGDGNWVDSSPISSEVSSLFSAAPLVSCGEKPSHFMLRYKGSFEKCQELQDSMHKVGWDIWLKEWKKEFNTDLR